MAEQYISIAADGHLHWYPFYRPASAVESLSCNLDSMRGKPGAEDRPRLNLGFLVEGSGHSFFEELKAGEVNIASREMNIEPCGDGKSLLFMRGGTCRLCLIAGRQIATRERIEILGLGLAEPVSDGRPAQETVARVLDLGGLPVLPWAPGKWLFRRGALVRELIERARPGELMIGDSSLRPRSFPMPGLMRLGIEKGLTLVPGSDPLPLRGEESLMGSYGFTCAAPFDLDRPAYSAARMLSGGPCCIRPAGARNSVPRAVSRMARLRFAKRFGK